MLNPESIEADVVARLKLGGHKSELSPQAVAVIQSICKAVNELIQKKKPQPSESVKRKFTDDWGAKWEERFGGPYKFNGAADGKAADELLKLYPPDKLLAIAAKAWAQPEQFNCKHAITLRGFASRFTEIRGEVGEVNGAASRSSHITAAGIDTRTGERVFMP